MNLVTATDRLLKKHFFQPTAAASLSLFRFLYCGLLVWKLAGDAAAHRGRFYSGLDWYPIPLFELFHIPLMSAGAFHALQSVLLIALALTALGVFTRVSVPLAWISYCVYMGTYLGFGKSPHTSYVVHSHNIVVFVLFILAVAPGVGRYGFDGWRQRGWRWPAEPAVLSAWPNQLIKLTLGLAYFGAGYCKIATHPLWADGYTLQAYLMSKHLLIDCEPGAWVAQHYWLCLLLGVATLVLELSFFLVVFYPRLTWPYVFGAICFHASIYLTMQINFFPYYGYTFLIFLDWPTLKRLAAPVAGALAYIGLTRTSHRGSSPTIATSALAPLIHLGDSRAARVVILGLWGLLAFCTFARVESWPFTDYRVFNSRNRIDKVCVYRLAAIHESGQQLWIPRGWMPLSPTSLNSRMEAHVLKGPPESLAELLDQMAPHVARHDRAGKLHSVVVVERTLRWNSATASLEAIDRPLLETPLPRAAGDRSPILAAEERDALRR